MIRFTVTWNDDAVAELAAIWVTAKRRDAITQAADSIDQAFVTGLTLLDDGLTPLLPVFAQNMVLRLAEAVKGGGRR